MTTRARVGLALGLVVACLLVAGIYCLGDAPFREEREHFRSAKVGMSESEVEKRFGKPDRVYLRETAPVDYYVEGYQHKRRPITKKVNIYIGTESIAYVYFGADDRVEEVFVGGS
jgi:hypothetical protein